MSKIKYVGGQVDVARKRSGVESTCMSEEQVQQAIDEYWEIVGCDDETDDRCLERTLEKCCEFYTLHYASECEWDYEWDDEYIYFEAYDIGKVEVSND